MYQLFRCVRTRSRLRYVGLPGLATMAALALACGNSANYPVTPSVTRVPASGNNRSVPVGDASVFRMMGQTIGNVCHNTEGTNEFVLISIADPAIETHLAHGDGQVGDSFPGQPGMVFGETCTPVPAGLILDVNDAGILTGAFNVEVLGGFYDVRFRDGSCIDLFDGCDDPTSDFFFQTEGDALAAGQALLDHVFIDDPVLGSFDSLPLLTAGCSNHDFCAAFTPYGLRDIDPNVVQTAVAHNWGQFSSEDDFAYLTFAFNAIDTGDSRPQMVYAIWTPAGLGTP